MPSKFGGIPVDEQPSGSKFGGIPVDDNALPGTANLPGGQAPGVPTPALPAPLKPFPQLKGYPSASTPTLGSPVMPVNLAAPTLVAAGLSKLDSMGKPAGKVPQLKGYPSSDTPTLGSPIIPKPGTEEMVSRRISGLIPSFDRAGENFQTVMGAARDIPIDTTEPGSHALRIHELAARGGMQPKIIRDFLGRTTKPDSSPLTYGEARDFASNASRLSADETGRLTAPVKREIAAFSKALNEANGGAADQAGVRPLYDSAMKEYRNAARLKAGLKTGAKVGAGMIGAGLTGEALKNYVIPRFFR